MSEFERFISEGILCSMSIGDTEDKLRSILGKPGIYEPAHKSYPTFAIYGPLEFRLKNGKICYIGLTIDYAIPLPDGFRLLTEGHAKMTLEATRRFLFDNNIAYTTDEIMSDETQTVLVTCRGVHLAFNIKGKLTKVASVPS